MNQQKSNQEKKPDNSDKSPKNTDPCLSCFTEYELSILKCDLCKDRIFLLHRQAI